MSTRFVSKRQSIAPGSLLSGEWQGISVLEGGLVKAKLELLEKEFDRPLDPFAKGRPIIAIGVLNGESDGRLKESLEEFAILLGTLWSANSPGANLSGEWIRAWRELPHEERFRAFPVQ